MLKSLYIMLIFSGMTWGQSPAFDAIDITNNIPGVTYQAQLNFGAGPIQGTITGASATNGTGVNFDISFFGFPDLEKNNYTYHVHRYPVPASGNCSETGGHLDPTLQDTLSDYTCSPISNPSRCEIGDLSGKHGKINQTDKDGVYRAHYLDTFFSTTPGSPEFFGNLSVVVHNQTGQRLNCGNFYPISPAPSTATTNTTTRTEEGSATSAVTTMPANSSYTVSTLSLRGSSSMTISSAFISATSSANGQHALSINDGVVGWVISIAMGLLIL